MVHVENTPNYALGVMKLFYKAYQFLSDMKDVDAEEFANGLHRAAEFVAWAYLPSGFPAPIGDYNRPEQMRKAVYSYSNRLSFASSMGEAGTMSEDEKKETTKYYPDAGYFFYRENWDAENSTDATWKMLKAGYSSRTHKHADDLSFMLYSKGYEIFTDPGFYNYIYGSPYRDYLTSSSAHNTITVDEKSYSISVENSSKTGMLSCSSTDRVDFVSAFSDMYYGVEIDRNFYSSGDLTVLYDNIVSEEEHDYAQLFQLGEDIHVSLVPTPKGGDLLAEIANTGFRVRIRQALPAGLEIISGKETAPRYGHICRQMGEVIDSQTLKYSKSGTNADFITIITIEDGDGMVRLKDGSGVHYSEVVYDEAKHTVSFGDEEILLQARTRFYPEADAQLDSSGVLHLSAAAYEDCEYAWYLVDAETAKPFYKSDYSTGTELAYDISNQETDVLVKLYVRSKAVPQKKSALVAALVFDSPGRFHLDEGEKYPCLNLVYRGHSWEKLAENKYRFSIDYDYSWNTTQKWYVYRNNSFLDMTVTENERQFEYTFTEPGEYTIYYYLKTPNGDNEYWNFENIKISG